MITRSLNSKLEGYVPVTNQGPAGQADLEAIVDTGFNGFLSLAPQQIAELDLEWSRYETAELADAQEFLASLFTAEVFWDGTWKTIEVAALGSTPLLGMQLLHGCRLLIDVVENGQLTIKPLED